ncbi:50S ribosomal protein l17 [Grosmannia clavigera kw1407]|uniref:Large ribosomal subunit protein bL17m n=1 Tax=Grosmannia clavigera (strain kw1407 / UAMH 11150) TaxID=655863 RepID=F0XSL5_GROCL|nr:50S ribosomal protein l17 [Grosmannia clavigera kw1407]EFW99277.1 50S ribosomal protein l17 [Grosmannia clavigera kw1407]
MAGGLVKYRHLSRSSSHRQALLRNLVTSLVKNEAIHTTWPKAKEAQRLAEKLITLAKRDNEETRRKAQAILYLLLPKLFGTLKSRYADRPGGYTRVLRTEPKKGDQAPSAVLELVDGPRDMRFAVTAAAVARDRTLGRQHSDLTLRNRAKVTRFRHDGETAFETMVARTQSLRLADAGPQMADVETSIFQRSDPHWTPRKTKPVLDFWDPKSTKARTSRSSRDLVDALGDPSLSKAEAAANRRRPRA